LGLLGPVIIVTPFIIAGTASIKWIFGTWSCNSLRAHIHFGKCPFRDMDVEPVKILPKLFSAIQGCHSKWSLLAWCLLYQNVVLVTICELFTWQRFYFILFFEQRFWGYNLARNYLPYLLFYKKAGRLEKQFYFTPNFYNLRGKNPTQLFVNILQLQYTPFVNAVYASLF
jgi:hypothetical protein